MVVQGEGLSIGGNGRPVFESPSLTSCDDDDPPECLEVGLHNLVMFLNKPQFAVL